MYDVRMALYGSDVMNDELNRISCTAECREEEKNRCASGWFRTENNVDNVCTTIKTFRIGIVRCNWLRLRRTTTRCRTDRTPIRWLLLWWSWSWWWSCTRTVCLLPMHRSSNVLVLCLSAKNTCSAAHINQLTLDSCENILEKKQKKGKRNGMRILKREWERESEFL